MRRLRREYELELTFELQLMRYRFIVADRKVRTGLIASAVVSVRTGPQSIQVELNLSSL